MRWRDIPPLNTSQTESPEDPPPPKEETPRYFETLLKTGYYALIVPFRPDFNSSTHEYTLHSNKIQKYFCYVSYTLSIINRITNLRRTFHHTYDSPSTISYFQTTHALLHIIPYLIFFRTITNDDTILRLLNTLSKSGVIRTSSRNKPIRTLIIGSQIVWLMLAVSSPLVGYETLNSCCWSTSNLGLGYLAHGRYTFMASWTVNETVPAQPEVYTVLDVVVLITQSVITTAHVFLLFFIVTLFGNCAVVLWLNATGFCEIVDGCLEGNHGVDVEEGIRCDLKSSYNDMRSLAGAVNGAWHLLAFWYMIDLTAWLSTELDSGVRTTDYFVKTHIFYYLVYVCVALCFSAEAFRKIDKLKAKTKDTETAKKLVSTVNSEEHVHQVLRSLKSDVVGIGEVGFFKLNYPFIGQLTGLIITFYIISVGEHNTGAAMIKTGNSCGQCFIL